jgi:chromosome segregation protein
MRRLVMFLEKIELKGFKSFSDELKIDFNSGITSIVGPNGSGKSNITDAIRWVLGEQKYKVLRGDKMEDVIFNGTSTRKPLSYASVALYFDNSTGIFNIEYNKVSIKRIYYRTGESEFYINENIVRLKDIKELLMDTGIGVDGYSIIGQGDIDKILSDNKFDRRQIIEEAAGTVKFSYQRDEALKKLENAKINIERITDIMNEINSRLVPLKTQRDKAIEYKQLFDSIKESDIYYRIKDYIESEEELVNLNNKIDNSDKTINNINNSLKDIDVDNREMFNKINSFEFEIKSISNEKLNESLELDKIKYKKEKLTSEIVHHKSQIDKINNQISENNLIINRLMEEFDRLNAEDKISLDYISKLEIKISEQGHLIDDLKNTKESDNNLREEILKSQIIIDSLKMTIINLNNRIDENNNNLASIEEKLTKLNNSKLEIEKQLEESIIYKNSLEKDLNENGDTLNSLKNKLDEVKDNINNKNTLITSLKSKSQVIKNTLENQIRAQNEYEHFGYNFKNIMSFIKSVDKNNKVEGTVSDILKIPREYETAISVTLGRTLSNIVVDTSDSAKNILKELKLNKIGSATFLPYKELSRNNSFVFDKKDGIHGLGNNLVNYDKKYEMMISYLLSSTLIVDDIDTAINVSKTSKGFSKAVTLDGDVVIPNGPITGGFKDKKDNMFESLRAIENNKKLFEANELQIMKLETEIIKEQSSLEFIKNEITKLNSTINSINSNLNKNNNIILDKMQNIDRYLSQIKSVESEYSSKLLLIEEDKIHISEKSEETEKLKNSQDSLEKRYNKIQTIDFNSFDEISKKNSELEIEKSRLEQKLIYSNQSQINNKNEILNLEMKNTKFNFEIVENESSIEQIVLEIESVDVIIDELTQKLNYIEENIISKEEQLYNMKLGYNKNLELRNELQKELTYQKEIQSKISMDKFKFESKVSDISFKLWEDYEMSIVESKKVFSNCEPVSKGELNQNKKRLKSIGPINIDSIEEFDSVNERYMFLKTQLDDMHLSRSKLLKLISDLESNIKTNFIKTFEKVNNAFNDTISALFGGGYGKLILTDEEDLLSTDIDIVVMPPGKKLSNLNLLSGGEKTLAAISLLFAVLKIKPSAFCVLDEIEAALDDNNITRFGNFIKNFTNNIQFILITHKRGTMEISDHLYGVTMQEKGVSSIISINLVDYKENLEENETI